MSARYTLPPYAYIPGQTPRHAETEFDDIINSLPDKINYESLQAATGYKYALEFMQHGFHWEAHEILEAIWMKTAQNSVERLFTQCVIHLANANLKHIMNRESAAAKIMKQANSLSTEIQLRAPNSEADFEIRDLMFKYAL